MSADLFAEFGNFSQTSQQQQQSTQPNANTPQPANKPTDPFAFLQPTRPAAQPQLSQQTQPWPSLQQSQPSSSVRGDLSSFGGGGNQTVISQEPAGDDDGWGDFEVAPTTSAAAAPPRQNQMLHQAAVASNAQIPQKTRIVRAGTLDLISNNLVDVGGLSACGRPSQPTQSPWGHPAAAAPKPPQPKNSDPNVLFDADDYDGVPPEEDDDEFGDFEAVEPAAKAPADPFDFLSSGFGSSQASAPSQVRQQPPSELLSSLSIRDSSATGYPEAPKSPSFQERNPFPGLALTTRQASEFPKKEEAKQKSESPITTWPSSEAGRAAKDQGSFKDDWSALEDFSSGGRHTHAADKDTPGWDWDAADGVKPQVKSSDALRSRPPTQNKKPQPPPSTEPEVNWDWDAAEPPAQPAESAKPSTPPAVAPPLTDHPETLPPPTNIPPPSILLSIVPSLLDLADSALFQPLAGQPPATKDQVLSDPATRAFLHAYLALAAVVARVIAGRKLRWHRDRFLAQGMAISAAGGAAKKGMKLAGVDRTQAAREDREAADVAAAWRARVVGRLRSAVATANAAGGGQGQQLRVPELTEKMGIATAKMVPTAAKACVVCGLKREERVAGVDVDVEDSFGEWWVEHWGHRACRNFWLEHEGKLRSR